MNQWIVNKKVSFIVSILGGVVGYFYWFYVGCESGTCAITSVWYRTVIYGVIMGWLVGEMINDKLKKSNDEN